MVEKQAEGGNKEKHRHGKTGENICEEKKMDIYIRVAESKSAGVDAEHPEHGDGTHIVKFVNMNFGQDAFLLSKGEGDRGYFPDTNTW